MEQYDLLKQVIWAFESSGIRYFVTGSIASIFYGEPRFTNDIDIVADVKEKDVPALMKFFPKDEFYISEEQVFDAIRIKGQFNIIQPSTGLKVDVIICKEDEFDNSRFERVKKVLPVEKMQANFSSPEDVIIMKMRYYKEGGSEKHIRDIVSMIKILGDEIDKNYIVGWVRKFEIENIWQTILRKLNKTEEL